MNKQLRQFERESGLDIYGLGKDRAKWERSLANYAELIVRECADVLLEWKKEPFPFDEDVAASLIKEHFGVEK